LKERKLHRTVKMGAGLAAISLAISSCSRGDVPIPVIPEQPTEPYTTVPIPTETSAPTLEPTLTPNAVFGRVGYIPGVFPPLGGETWVFVDMDTLSCGGMVDTTIIRTEGYTPLAEEGCKVSLQAVGANDTSFFLVPRLDLAQYVRADGLLGVAAYNPELSTELVSVYSDGSQVIYQQPGVMTNFQDGAVPLLGREDVTGDVWVLYVGDGGSIVRRAPAFFGGQDTVQVVEGTVLVNGRNMLIGAEAWDILPTPVPESVWDPDRIKWSKLVEGTYNGVDCQMSLEIDFSLYERSVNALVGFEEAGGTFQDVGNTCAATISMLPETGNGNRSVEVNMELRTDGTYVPLDFNPYNRSENIRVQFDPEVPIRFIFFNGDGGINGRVFPWHPGTSGGESPSRGWGIDPETKGLVVFVGLLSSTSEEYKSIRTKTASNAVFVMLAVLAQAGDGVLEPLNEAKYDTLHGIYFKSGHPVLGVYTDE